MFNISGQIFVTRVKNGQEPFFLIGLHKKKVA